MSYLAKSGSAKGDDLTVLGGGVGAGGVLEGRSLFSCLRASGWCCLLGPDRIYRSEGGEVVLCWPTGVAKGPERQTDGVRQYRGGRLGVVHSWGVGGRAPGWPLVTRGSGLP